MSYFFNISACLFLVILQTTVMPYLPLLEKFYDLLIPFIVYLGLSRPVRESLPFVLFLGFIMDNLSGGPFGLYLTTYFWLYVGVKGITMFIQVGNRLLCAFLKNNRNKDPVKMAQRTWMATISIASPANFCLDPKIANVPNKIRFSNNTPPATIRAIISRRFPT